MATLKKIKLKTEKELHSVIEKEIDALEEGLEILKYEFALGSKGTPDFLCIDSGGILVIIEVKLQEDDNVLFQALRYYNGIDKERYAIAKMFTGKTINAEEHPRIIIIAEKFSDDLRRLCTLLVPDVELYEYTVLLTQKENQGICYHPVSLPKIEEIPAKPRTIKDLQNYITKVSLRPKFSDLIKRIKSIGKGIDEYMTQYYVGFKFKGRMIAWLEPHRQSFDIGAIIVDENDYKISEDYTRIETGTENFSETFEKIENTFTTLSEEE